MDKNNNKKKENTLIDSSLTNSDTNENFDIRNYMNYDLIRKVLLKSPTELALFEITCILINNNIKSKND